MQQGSTGCGTPYCFLGLQESGTGTVRVCIRIFAIVIDFVLHLGPLRVFISANSLHLT